MDIVYNIDCIEYMKSCKDNQFDLAICDPPYGLGTKNRIGGGLAKAKKYKSCTKWDKKPNKEYFLELFRVSKNQIIWGSNYFTEFLKSTKSFIFWDKGRRGLDFSDGELAWTSFNKPARYFRWVWDGFRQEDQKNKEFRIHPTQKPVGLYKYLLSEYGKKGDIIFDSHVGSGSSRIACKDMNFSFVGCEIDKEFYTQQEIRYKNHVGTV